MPADQTASTSLTEAGGIAHEVGELHRLLVESVEDYAIFALDPDGYILSWNAGAERLKGYRADEIIGKHFSIFYPQEKVAEQFPQFELREAARNGRFEDEGWRVRKDGSRFWANVVITALRDKTGKLLGFAKVTRDLTERRAAEERAIEAARRVATEEEARRIAEVTKERVQRLQRLTAALSAARSVDEVAKTVCDTGFSITGADAGALGLVDDPAECVRLVCDAGLGLLPPRLRRMTLDDKTPMCDAVRNREPVVINSAAERDRRYPGLPPSLGKFDAGVTIPLMVNEKVVGALSLFRRKQIGEEALDFMKAVAREVAQALDRARLYEAEQQARSRADEANRVKSEFLASMSHELRTPLNAIAGYADLIEAGVRGPVTEAQKKDLERIKRAQSHLLGIINDILNFSKIEAGQIEYEFEAVRLREIIEAVCLMVTPQAAKKGLRLETADCPAEAVAWADRTKVEQILINLLSNAVKFTDHGSVRFGCELSEDNAVLVSVIDTGHGIATAHLGKIFEPFVQVGRMLNKSREGTGLGLAISRDLARGMKGDLWAESEEGKGSTFTLKLPRAKG